jgi:regulator of protease activity HflC (stomatin/prohibitin superfamily)
MGESRLPKLPWSSGPGEGRGGPAEQRRQNVSLGHTLLSLLLVAAILYGGYFWFVRRVVVGPDEVLVVLKKDGSRSLEGDQIIIPRPPDPKDASASAAWEQAYGDVNGILEAVYPPGTYFKFSPFDYERAVINIKQTADVPIGKLGVVVKKFGQRLPPGQVLADQAQDQRGPLPMTLQPGRHYQYANPYAYTIKQVDPLTVDAGYRGVVTVMAAAPAKNPNQYLVEDGEQGVQRQTEPEGFRYFNPFVKRVTPISIRSHRFEMTGAEAIEFPSSDSFDIRLEGFVEWSIVPDWLPETYVKYSEGAELIPLLETTIILPYARSFSRLVGSQYNARDFISGDTKLKFQQEFESRLREACAAQGVEVLQALVRDIIPPEAIKDPINEREIAKERILQYEQQIKYAQTEAERVKQEEIVKQNTAIGEANKAVVTIEKQAQQDYEVALTQAQQKLAVAKLRLEAARKQADATVARGQAEANIILLKKRAEAEPLRQQIAAFGGGDAYARYFFYQNMAPSIKSILSNTEGPFADLFKQFAVPAPASPVGEERPQKVTGVQP